MGQGFSQTLPPGPGAIEAPDLSDLIFEKSLGGARFLRTIRAKHTSGVVVVKICQKLGPSVSFRDYATALQDERRRLQDVPNVLAYQRIRETNTHGVLVRQYIHSSLYDRISTRPFLESIEKKWIAFQLLSAVKDCHARGVFHGDIKSENVLVTSWGWVLLTDFASAFKPVYLPEDNPAEFSFFYDTSARRTCYLAPERFLTKGETPREGNIVQWNMDIFSLGCVLAELFTESPTFTLTQMFRYRRNEYDPTVFLGEKVDEVHVRAMISNMVRMDPSERWHAQDHLDEYKSKVFPIYFYQHLHALLHDITDPTGGRKIRSSEKFNNAESDDRIDRIHRDYPMLMISLGFSDPIDTNKTTDVASEHARLFPLQIDTPSSRQVATASVTTVHDNGTLILLNIVTASIRSAAHASSKIKACELLLAFAQRIPDEAKLDRVLPYVVPLLEDTAELVVIAALRTMTQLFSMIKVASPINSLVLTQYIFPRLQALIASKAFKNSSLVRTTCARCLAPLGESALRFLDIMQALRSDNPLRPTKHVGEDDRDDVFIGDEAYDSVRADVVQQFEAQTKLFLTDNATVVRRAFLESVPTMCVLLGESKAADSVISHLNTYLNDTDWQLKRAFFKTMVGMAIFVGGPGLEEFLLPLMLQALTDPQEFVIEQTLRSLASIAELGLFQRSKLWELIDLIARFSMHPNVWIKESAIHFITAATTYLSITDVRILVMPLVQPYLKVSISSCSTEEILDALKKPLPRPVYDLAISWAQRAERGLFWKSARESRQPSYRFSGQMPPTSSVLELGNRSLGRLPKTDEDEQWLGRLRNAGMRVEDEMKLLVFRDYLWRTAQRQKRTEDTSANVSIYDHILKLNDYGVRPQTVLFEASVETDERYLPAGKDTTIAEALEEAITPLPEAEESLLQLPKLQTDDIDDGNPAERIPASLFTFDGSRKRTPGEEASSAGSRLAIVAKGAEKSIAHKPSVIGLLGGPDIKSKASAEVATDETNATFRPNARNSRSEASTLIVDKGRRTARGLSPTKRTHNYEGNDPSVLKLLDAIYIDAFPVDAADFGPLVAPLKRGPIPTSTVLSNSSTWRPQGQFMAVLAEHTASVTRLVVAPDHSFFLTGSADGTVKIWDSARLERNVSHRSRQTHRLPGSAAVTSLCFIEATHAFVCTGSDGSVQVVKVEVSIEENSNKYGKCRVLREWKLPGVAGGMEYCVWTEHYRVESVGTLMLATNHGRIISVDLRQMAINYEFRNPAQHGTPTCFCIGRRRDWMLIGTAHGVLDLWDLRFRLRLRSWTFHYPAPISRLQIHPGRKTARRNRVCMSGGTGRGDMTVWDIEKTICHELYRPAHRSRDRINQRQYELKVLDDEHAEGILTRAVEELKTQIDAQDAQKTDMAMIFGTQYSDTDPDVIHNFAVSGGPDGKVRFWDCERVDGCKVISTDRVGENVVYTYSQLGMDTRILTETVAEPDVQNASETTGKAQGRGGRESTTSGKKASAAVNTNANANMTTTTKKVSRFETIRESARQLLHGHLDTITDVALLERPFGMILSADRSGQVFVYQ